MVDAASRDNFAVQRSNLKPINGEKINQRFRFHPVTRVCSLRLCTTTILKTQLGELVLV
jgi:hypothetical protein